MASIDELLAETSQPNSDLLKFYESNNDKLVNLRLSQVPNLLLLKISVILHDTMRNETEWMDLLSQLGINNFSIKFIKLQSKLSEMSPIYIALRGCLQHKRRLDEVVHTLKENERMDVLHEIKSDVENLLEKLSLESKCDLQIPSAPALEDNDNSGKYDSHTKDIFPDNQKDCVTEENLTLKSDLKFSYNSAISKCTNMCPDSGYKSLSSVPMISIKNTITIFILHAEIDKEIATRLSNILIKSNMIVKTHEMLEYLLLKDPVDAKMALLNDVDFIIPITSEHLFEQLHPSVQHIQNDIYSENESFNRDIYKLLSNEYLINKCLNFRVRPVLVPPMKRNRLKFDPLLFYALQLWEEVPNLIKILIKTKEKMFNKNQM